MRIRSSEPPPDRGERPPRKRPTCKARTPTAMIATRISRRVMSRRFAEVNLGSGVGRES